MMKQMPQLILALASGLAAAAFTPVHAQKSDALTVQLDQWFTEWMRDEHIPGAAFVLVRNGTIAIQKGYGVADVERRTTVSPTSTVWPFGSIAKVMTATAVAQLADRGKISLDADANVYLKTVKLPERSGSAPIRVRDLVTHTNALDELPGRGASSRGAVLPLRGFLPGRLVRFAASGRITRYSSYGMSVAGLLVEGVTGLAFSDYVQREIFQPLGMTKTTMSGRDVALSSMATPYERSDTNVIRAQLEWHHTIPSSTLLSTAADMAKFVRAQLEGNAALLSDSMRANMQQQQASIHPRIPGWGIGWQLANLNGIRIVEHGGDIGGFAALIVLLPDLNSGFVIVSHIEGSNLRFRIRNALVQRLADNSGRGAASTEEVRVITGKPRPELGGVYVANNYCRTCAGGAANAQRFRIDTNADGSLTLWNTRWLPTEDSLLFVSENGQQRIGFMMNADGSVAAVSAGAWRVLEPAPRP
jgi:CubicO group peptidase (beta-lactamase class C family)